jgi:hypothetical protein
MDEKVKQILKLLEQCSVEQREIVFRELRKEITIHPIEEKLNIQAEIILEAINKDAKGLTLRMIRGVIAEAAFDIEVISFLQNWENITPDGDLPYDFMLQDKYGSVKVQVKLQRSLDLKPMKAIEAYRKFSEDLFVVETQKTRGGKDVEGNDTRPYDFGDFDIIAVCMQPSKGEWSSFSYTLSRWLIPRDDDKSKMLKFQPVSAIPNNFWTDDFITVVQWFRSGVNKTIPF